MNPVFDETCWLQGGNRGWHSDVAVRSTSIRIQYAPVNASTRTRNSSGYRSRYKRQRFHLNKPPLSLLVYVLDGDFRSRTILDESLRYCFQAVSLHN